MTDDEFLENAGNDTAGEEVMPQGSTDAEPQAGVAVPQSIDDSEPQDIDGDDGGSVTKGEPKESEPDKPSRASERIKQLVDERNRERTEAEQLRAELERLKQAEQTAPKTPPTESADGRPLPPDIDGFDIETEEGLQAYFEQHAKYDQQLKIWEIDQRLNERERARQQAEHERQMQDEFAKAFERHPKFKQDFANLHTWMQDKPVTADPSVLYQGEELMDLLAEVASDADLYYELAGMSEQQQYAKYGQIQASIQSRKTKTSAVRTTKAPPPPNHTKSNAPIKREMHKLSDDDFLAARGL